MRIPGQTVNSVNSTPLSPATRAQEHMDLDRAIALSLAVPGLDKRLLTSEARPVAAALPKPGERCTCSFCLPRVRTFTGIQPLPASFTGAPRRAYVLAFVASDPKLSFLEKHQIALDEVFARSLAVRGLDEAQLAPQNIGAKVEAY